MKMMIEYNFELFNEDKSFKRNAWGTSELDIAKLQKLEKKIFDYGYSIGDFIKFFLENIDEKSTEDLLFAMDHYRK